MIGLRRFLDSCILQRSLQLPSNRAAVACYGFSVTTESSTSETPREKLSQIKPTVGHENRLIGRDFLHLKHFSSDELKQFLWTARDLKTRIKNNGEIFQPLHGKTAALVFQKKSTHTRLSAELGIGKLGGHACFLGPNDIHLGVGESVKDTAKVLANMADIILASVHSQDILDDFANESNVPVVSGLSGLHHPLQVLADFMTMQEYFGYLRGLKIAWIGDVNSVLYSLMYGCAKIGIDLNIATPASYEPDPDITFDVLKISGKTGASFMVGHDPVQAAYRADVIIADSWAGVGQEYEKNKRLQDFAGFQINRKMLKEAGGDWVFLHRLPWKREEVTEDIFYGQESLVWQDAENRMWTAMAVVLHLLQPYTPTIPMPKFVRG